MSFHESAVEEAALQWFESIGYAVAHGPELLLDGTTPERDETTVVLAGRLRSAVERLNPGIPASAIDDAYKKLLHPEGSTLEAMNRSLHRMVVDGVTVEFRRADGSIGGGQLRVIDFDDPDANDWLAVNQVTVIEGDKHRRPDIVVYINGLPLSVIELKNAADEKADLRAAYNQLQTYKSEIPALLSYDEALVISDGLQARIGTLTAGREWFMPWRTIEGEELASATMPQLKVLILGVFDKRRVLDLIRHFVVFEDNGDGSLAKKMAGYHQFHAVNAALSATLRASGRTDDVLLAAEDRATWGDSAGEPGDRRVGVVWHTQGSGKSLTMAFYAGRVIAHPAMENPTIVVITDRNDLDDQLFGTFARCHELLRQPPVQVRDRADLREKLTVDAGGVVFTTVQKFFPEERGDAYPVLSERRNIVVIADEAHRSQYDFIDGYARHMRDALPNASFIGFTGTPIESSDKNTRSVFGDYVSVYDIQRAVEDGATVPIYYESRLAKLELVEEELPRLDPEFEEITEAEEQERKERLKSKWAQLESLVGTEKRLRLVAEDMVAHFEHRLEAMDGKAMFVCMSRRICVDLYNEIIALRPEWAGTNDSDGALKVVMTGSAPDPVDWQQHIRNKPRREALAKRFKDPDDPFKLVIVRDMWLTGFDAPCLHTMYVDKPMRGHGLMQAIARVNRVFRNKPGGLVVDYIGLADQMKKALADYTNSGGRGKTAIDQAEAVAVMIEKYEVVTGIMHGFDWRRWFGGGPTDRLELLAEAYEHVLALPDGKKRFMQAVTELSQAFALAVPADEAIAMRDDVGFFQALRSGLAKGDGPEGGRSEEEIELAIRQLVSKAVAPCEVVDIFAAAGLDRPDISILSDEFLEEVRHLPQRNLAVETLRRLLQGEIRTRSRKNVVQARSFEAMLQESIRRYQNRAIEAAQVIEELIQLAKEMREAQARGDELGLNDDEVAFYDALAMNESAVRELGDEVLAQIAQELVERVRQSATIDWKVRQSARSQMKVMIKRLLRKYKYPPDQQEAAVKLVIEQAEVLSEGWAA
ncbi:MAG: type I restriction endonuclease subunit R [Coriobacteriia bacterium]|nr:type I restriction endonuclease subunit R [Coriobacteriia bacterium]